MFGGFGANLFDHVAHLLVRLPPQRVDVGMLAGHGNRRCRGAAKVQRDMRQLRGFDLRVRTLELVVSALMVKGLVTGPLLTHHAEVFVAARIAFVLADVTAVGAQFLVVAAGDDVYRRAPAIEHVQRRKLSGRHGRGDEPRAMRYEEFQRAGHAGGMCCNQRAVRAVGVVRDQRAIKTCVFMSLGHRLHVVGLDGRATARVNFRTGLGGDVANEFDAYENSCQWLRSVRPCREAP